MRVEGVNIYFQQLCWLYEFLTKRSFSGGPWQEKYTVLSFKRHKIEKIIYNRSYYEFLQHRCRLSWWDFSCCFHNIGIHGRTWMNSKCPSACARIAKLLFFKLFGQLKDSSTNKTYYKRFDLPPLPSTQLETLMSSNMELSVRSLTSRSWDQHLGRHLIHFR